jgi:ribosomal protein S11
MITVSKLSKKLLRIGKSFIFDEQTLKYARLYINRSFSNIFITLTDSNNKVVICKSAGNAGIDGNKRRKTAIQVIEPIVNQLCAYFELYSVHKINIIVKYDMTAHLNKLLRELKLVGIEINSIKVLVKFAHNGVRARKIPRK